MVVQHNLTAMNANRMLNITTGAQSKATEKLSSGYRINRAADDAAGLTISEKMRKQIKGLNRASSNAEDGVSAVQTAEGALTEVHSMLQRMNELAVQASTGTNAASDRSAIQDEIAQLTTEIDRVSETTKFNELYLLKGNGTKGTKTLEAHDAGLAGKLTAADDGKYTFKIDDLDGKVSIGGVDYSIVDSADAADYTDLKTYTDNGPTSGDKLTSSGTNYIYYAANDTDANGATVGADGWYEEGDSTLPAYTGIKAGDTLLVKGSDHATTVIGNKAAAYTAKSVEDIQTAIKGLAAGKTVKIRDKATGQDTSYTIGVSTKADQSVYTADDIAAMIKEGQYVDDGTNKYYALPKASEESTKITINDAYKKMAEELQKANNIGANKEQAVVKDNHDGSFTITPGKAKVDEALSFSLHVGADADMTNKITVDIASMSSSGLGIAGIDVSGDTVENATYAIDAINDAIATVSKQRSALGAVQNRLEHTIANLDNVAENTTSAESRIRDTDMAEEMVEYSKNNILAQAGQSMLAQANQSTQGVLSLLQ